MTTEANVTTIYQDAALATDGKTMQGERHPASALNEVLLRVHGGLLATNTWDAADAAVAAIEDEQTVRLALSRLLALRLFADQETEPQVAMRNVKPGDYVRLHGTVCYVREVLDTATRRAYNRGITLKVNYHSPDGKDATFAYDANVQIPLIARPKVAA